MRNNPGEESSEPDEIMLEQKSADDSAWQGLFQPDGGLRISDAEY
jgi:hypothetical protein